MAGRESLVCVMNLDAKFNLHLTEIKQDLEQGRREEVGRGKVSLDQFLSREQASLLLLN